MTITASEARQRLFPLIAQVNDDHAEVHIASAKGNAVLISEEDFSAWRETVYLLSSPANAVRLMQAVTRDRADALRVEKTMEELLESLGGDAEGSA